MVTAVICKTENPLQRRQEALTESGFGARRGAASKAKMINILQYDYEFHKIATLPPIPGVSQKSEEYEYFCNLAKNPSPQSPSLHAGKGK